MVLAAAVSLARTPESLTTWIGIAAFLIASTIAERFPVPLDGVEANGVSLTFVFAVAGIVLFGWAAGALIMSTSLLVMQLLEHRPRDPRHLQRVGAGDLGGRRRARDPAAGVATRIRVSSCCRSRCARSSTTR